MSGLNDCYDDIILKLVSEKEKIIDIDNKGEGGKNE